MQIGCAAPTSGPLIGPDSLLRIAVEAEALGYDYVTVSDHVMIPTSIA
jgi:alkanesulfonate monooxygenase SsuD/methylene tetrahydromethanopterin reductase-like flavin-dependent oxidoreductase (luciferase family)